MKKEKNTEKILQIIKSRTFVYGAAAIVGCFIIHTGFSAYIRSYIEDKSCEGESEIVCNCIVDGIEKNLSITEKLTLPITNKPPRKAKEITSELFGCYMLKMIEQ